MIALDRAYLAGLRGDAERGAAYSVLALAEADQDEWRLASLARACLGLAEWLRGRPAEAEQLLSSAISQWRASGEQSLAALGCHYLSQVQTAQGRLDAAGATCQQAIEIAAAPGGRSSPAASAGHVGLALLAIQQDDLDAALCHLTEGIPLARSFAFTQPLAAGLSALAWIRKARGDAAGAREAMAEAGRIAPGPSVTGLLNRVPAQRAGLLLAQGDVAAAARWAAENGLSADDTPAFSREPEYLLLARLLLAQDRPARALTLLDKLLTLAAAQGRTGSLIKIGALHALALAAAGDQPAAIDALIRVISLACPQGWVRVFADEGAPMGSLLRLVAAARRDERPGARDADPGFLARLLAATGSTDTAVGSGRRAVAAVPGLVDPPTARELEVLRLLAAGAQNQAIAGELVISLDTAKKHVSHVLTKLGAGNRTEAVARARQVGLIP